MIRWSEVNDAALGYHWPSGDMSGGSSASRLQEVKLWIRGDFGIPLKGNADQVK